MIKSLILLITIASTIYCESSIADLLNLKDEEKVCLLGSSNPKKIYWLPNREFSSPEPECDAAIVLHHSRAATPVLEQMTSALKPGGRALILLSPIDSPEEEMIGWMAQSSKWKNRLGDFDSLSIGECKELLHTLGFTIAHSEVHGKIATFENREDFKAWVMEEIAPTTKLLPSDYDAFADDFVEYAEQGFCSKSRDGKIHLLTKQLLLLVNL